MIKLKWIITLGLLLAVVGYSNAQEIVLNKYRFGEGLSFSGKNGNYEMDFSGYVQPYLESRKFLDNDDATSYNRFRMRRARLQLSGSSAQDKLTYRLQLDLTGGGEFDAALGSVLYDACIGYDVSKRWNVSFGQKATPTDNLEFAMRSVTLQLVDRSALSSAFGCIREFGFFADSKYKISRYSYIKPQLAITNGDGINVFHKDHGGLKYGGRIDYLPFGMFNNFGQYRQADLVRELAPKFVIGATYSYNVGISDRRGRQSESILYLDKNNSELLPDYVKYGVDFLFKYRGFSMLGEYVNASSRVSSQISKYIRNNGTIDTSVLTTDVKNRMMVGEGYNLQGGYVFKNYISIDGRFSYLKPEANSFLNNGLYYNRSHYYTFGLTKYLGRSYGAKIQLDCTYTNAKPGSFDINSIPIKGNEFLTRIMTTFSF